jgi:hypothetical protein
VIRTLAANDHGPQAGGQGLRRAREVVRQLVEEGGGQLQQRDRLALHHVQQALGRAGAVLVADDHAGPGQQRGHHLFQVHIEAGRGELQHAVPGARAASSAVMASACATSARCGTHTPLGRPVVPEV